jgi:type I restriction enzyme S subunit
VAEFTIVIPSDGIAEAFNDRVAPLFQRIYANIETAKVLADLRDALHPSLISGKTRLAEFQEELRELIA